MVIFLIAIAWSPHHHGLLASGGGTADRCIRFWNTLTGQPMQCIDTGSQVCNLAWSKHSSELVRILVTFSLFVLMYGFLTNSDIFFIHAGEYSWILPEPNSAVEVPIPAASGKADWPLLPCLVFSNVSRRWSNSDWCWRWNAEILERI